MDEITQSSIPSDYNVHDREVIEETGKRLIWQTSCGERVFLHRRSLIVEMPPGRCTLTTSWLNGGYREDLRFIFNNQMFDTPEHSHETSSIEGGNIAAYIAIIAERLGLDPSRTTGLLTAANMENVAISTHSYRNLEVTAIITGGIEVNGGRAGDPASYYQENGQVKMIPGTINTILLIGASVPHYAMTNAIVTASEAKAVAIQQLMAPSQYSEGIATGSGTDMIAVVSDKTSSVFLDDAGKHSKLGELIGLCVIEATQKALARQSELTALSQCNMLVRLERFEIGENKYWKTASMLEGENRKSYFVSQLRNISKNPALVSSTASMLHILDEISWGLIPENAGKKAAFSLMKGLPEVLMTKKYPPFSTLLDEKDTILENWIRVTAWIAKNDTCGSSEWSLQKGQ